MSTEEDTQTGVVSVPPTALEAMTRGRISAQIAEAKLTPRNVKECQDRARRLAMYDPEGCHYSIPRAGKNIQGPSVGLALIMGTQWRNLKVASHVIDIGAKEVTVCAVAHDVETNVELSTEVQRCIIGKDGRRFRDDMITVTANAAHSIAKRNVILQIIPKAIWGPVYNAVLDAIGSGKIPLVERRTKAIAWFAARGVKEETILKKLNRANVGEIDGEDIKVLLGISNAIKEETATVEEIFGEPGPGPEVRNSRPLNLKKEPAMDQETEREPGEDREEDRQR